MAICYLTGNVITEKDDPNKNNHNSLEHIIPNALGGKICSNHVITFKANQQLNEEVDIEFTKIFTGFVARLPINKDRESTPSFSAFHLEYNIDAVFKGGKFFPKKPFYDAEKKIIYANSKKNCNNYKTYLDKIGATSKEDKIRFMDDLAGKINIPFELKNIVFKKGIAKIAAGFATLKGIERKNLKGIIDLETKKIKDKIVISPFLPTGAEELFERNKYKSIHYPIHSLVLCGKKATGFLYCYVNLFSAFQFYVLLDENYHGEDIYEYYIYDITGGKELTWNEYINSIPGSPDLSKKISTYRVINSENFIKNSHEHLKTKKYCHQNFHILSFFVNYTFIKQKSKELGLL